ncbi:MAG: response regulator [Sulfuritalea sp.]|nr:response regulator [Sulfuritalea sp.]
MSLRTRMLLLALLPATLVAVLLTTLFLSREIDDLERGLRTRGTAISRQMATAAEFGIFSGQRETLIALTAAARRIDPDVSGAAIVDEHGTIMVRSGILDQSRWPGLIRLEGHRLGSELLLFVEPVMRGSLPVDDIYAGAEVKSTANSKLIGHVVVEFSLREVSRKSEQLIAVGVFIALLGAAIGGWLAHRIARGVTQPLLEASEVVTRIGKGDLKARMATTSEGPLKSLAMGINDMAQRVGMTQDDLHMRIAEATNDLLQEKEAAEHATIAKSHFLAAASHDLRQPLHALGLLVSGLAQSKAAKQEPKLVTHIQAATDTLQNLLDAILDVSRLDGGNLVPRMSSFCLGDVLERLEDDLSLLATQKSLQLKFRATSVWVHSDQKIVERILQNLIGNAVRYTQAGGVLVSCRRRIDTALVEVWDTGEGIPEHSHQEIFGDYVQLGNPERARAKGLGLGLAICRRLADLLDIRMGVRSRPGRGSVFWIELPMVEGAPEIATKGAEHSKAGQDADSGGISGNILVVEGDGLVRTGMEQAIVGWGGSVRAATNRDEAIRLCKESDYAPDLSICNLRLHDETGGIALAQELQQQFPQMAVLLISADVSEEAQAAARRAGFALLKEPVPPGRLRAALHHLLGAKR